MRYPENTDQPEKSKTHWLDRFFEWPLSYCIGILIGGTVMLAIIALDTEALSMFETPGLILFTSGWALMIGTGHSSMMRKYIHPAREMTAQKWILRISLGIGIAMSAIASTFFTNLPQA